MKRQAQFYTLPRAVQHRFVESTRGVGAPAPMLVKLFRSRAHWSWGAACVLALVAWVSFSLLGYGQLDSSLAIAPAGVLVVHVAFAAFVVFCALKAQSKAWTNRRTPFATGTFLFPSGVIVSRLSKLTIFPIEDVQDVRVSGAAVDVVFAGQTFSFVAADAARAIEVPALVQEARTKHRDAKATNDIRQLLLLDPLQDSGVPNPLAPSEPLAPPVLLAPWATVLAVLAGGAILGWAVFWMRNTWSAKALYAAAVASDTTAAYRAYLERGGKRPEVEAILLPRAELREAQAKNSVEAIEAYIKRHAKTRIGPEITAAHRSALLAELEKAKKVGTLTALNQLEKKHAGYPLIQQELAAAKQAIFDRVLANFKNEAGKGTDVVPFVARLVHFARLNGAQLDGQKVEIRFQPKYTQNYEHIEDIVQKSPYYTGVPLLPGQYFKGKYPLEREARVGKRLKERLQRAFPSDILRFELGKQVGEDEGEPPQVSVPTLLVEHSVTFSGGFVGLRKQGMYMGMTLAYRATFLLPKDKGEYVQYRIRLWRAPKQELIDEAKTPEELYQALATDAYDTFATEYLEHWFKKP
ncbi:MAG TPA: hypothetical protein VI197_13315 [Polyangiaceae bacterium]